MVSKMTRQTGSVAIGISASVMALALGILPLSSADEAPQKQAAGAVPQKVAEPRVPAGIDPGGVPVALISTGVDYTDKRIAEQLARDGEGEVIGWDLIDNDRTPYAPSPNQTPPEQGGDGTALAKAVLAFNEGQPPAKKMSLMVFKVNGTDKTMIAKAMVFASKTAAQTVIVPVTGGTAEEWQLFKEAALSATKVNFVVPDCGIDGEAMKAETFPAAFRLQNLVIVGKNATLDGPYAAVVKAVCGF
jgi:hypothetical protein